MTTIHHDVHGYPLHDLAIYLTERICLNRGYKFLNKTALNDKGIYPGIPDVFIRVEAGYTDSKGRKHNAWQDYIIEIETKATRASIEKKTNQFDSTSGLELIIIDLSNVKHWDSWVILEQEIGRRLP